MSSTTAVPAAGAMSTARPTKAALIAGGLAACGPAAVSAYFAFRSGGFFAGAPGIVAVVLGVALMLRITLAEDPFSGFNGPLIWAAVSLGCYAAWTLVSALWSHAPAQALIEFDRALMYWLALVLFGSLPWSRERIAWTARVLAATMLAVAVLGLVTRILPQLHSIPAGFEDSRLSYPLSYWNALGIFVAVAILLCAGLATRREEPLASKALASAAIPILAATLYFTFSRGAIGALIIGLLVFAALAGPRQLVSPILAIVPPSAVAIVLCLGTDVLSTEHYAGPGGVSEGHKLAWVLIGCAVAGGFLRAALRGLDRRLEAITVSPQAGRRAMIASVAAGLLVIVVVAAATGAPGRVGDSFDNFADSNGVEESGELQSRLTSINNNGRLVQWELALDTFSGHLLHGSGAGTFARLWAKEGTGELKVIDAHSLYLEVMAELGVPGLLFIAATLIAILVSLARRIRGPDRALFAALFAAAVAWTLHAGVDWDWEMPATGFWLFALGGMAIAGSREETGSGRAPVPGRIGRAALGIGCLALVVSPALVALSQGSLDSAVRKLEAGDCGGASDDALSSIHVLSVRPEPYQVLGFCDSRAGEDTLAISLLQTAVNRDPDEWESYYGLALVEAAAGRDPRRAAREALELAPYEPLAQEAVRMFKTNDPQKWRRRALSARLPIL